MDIVGFGGSFNFFAMVLTPPAASGVWPDAVCFAARPRHAVMGSSQEQENQHVDGNDHHEQGRYDPFVRGEVWKGNGAPGVCGPWHHGEDPSVSALAYSTPAVLNDW